MRMPGVGKDKDAPLGFAMMGPDQIKDVRLSNIVAFGKRAGLLNTPINLNEKVRAMGQWA